MGDTLKKKSLHKRLIPLIFEKVQVWLQ